MVDRYRAWLGAGVLAGRVRQQCWRVPASRRRTTDRRPLPTLRLPRGPRGPTAPRPAVKRSPTMTSPARRRARLPRPTPMKTATRRRAGANTTRMTPTTMSPARMPRQEPTPKQTRTSPRTAKPANPPTARIPMPARRSRRLRPSRAASTGRRKPRGRPTPDRRRRPGRRGGDPACRRRRVRPRDDVRRAEHAGGELRDRPRERVRGHGHESRRGERPGIRITSRRS